MVDKEAWTESVSIYGTAEVPICNICGTDITGNTSAHAKEHMKAGKESGHHSEVSQKITGYNTVNHPEEGHRETRVHVVIGNKQTTAWTNRRTTNRAFW